MRFSRRLCLLLVAASLRGALAEGHADVPRALRIEFDPLNHAHVAVAAASFGEFLSSDGGEHWVMSCYDAQGETGAGLFSPSIEFTSGGALLSLAATALKRQGSDACTFDDVSSSGDRVFRGLHKAGDGSLYAVSSFNAGPGTPYENQLLRAGADGRVFTPAGAALDPSLALGSVVSAPSKTDTLYIVGHVGDSGEFRTLSSADGGQSWQNTFFPPVSGRSQIREVIGVDPNNPSIIFARIGYFDTGLGPEPPESLWFSRNGGSTWQSLVEGHGPMRGFAYSPDGKTLLIGGSQDGLFRVVASSLAELTAPVVTRVSPRAIWGLTWDESGLYAGGDEYAADPRARYTVGVSHDGGATFQKFMSVCDVVPPECSAAPAGEDAARCFTAGNYWTAMLTFCGKEADGGASGGASEGGAGGIGGRAGSGGVPASGGGTDAGTDAGDSSGGTEPIARDRLHITSCSATRPSTSRANSVVAAAFCASALGLFASRRRARHR